MSLASASSAAAAAFAAAAALASADFFAAAAFRCRSRVRFVADDLTVEDGEEVGFSGAFGVVAAGSLGGSSTTAVDGEEEEFVIAPENAVSATDEDSEVGAVDAAVDAVVDAAADAAADVDVDANVDADVAADVAAINSAVESFSFLSFVGMKGDAFSSNFLLLFCLKDCLGETDSGVAHSRFSLCCTRRGEWKQIDGDAAPMDVFVVGNSVLLSIRDTEIPISVTCFCKPENSEKR